ncbi:lipopolysaccharide export system ATP-binding protein LptB [Oxobacter pfennigii]|uniref:Lipopolysaccharide export system ATP-binding protein LptB n=1 Tax=Oxobacter pfennigii TaxID=36849 RepID=A0A0P8WNF4_9CLOT|nr:ABC transporter ATP-binding protein [Oxobacter pfennigii]KPU44067.1 lipopolysaccharide export system ATP-binding protein LptB [Oxobacter pfennigii]
MELLRVDNLSILFGGLKAVSEFNLTLEKNEIHGLIGPNGSGKTTCFNMLTGVYQPTTGEIKLDGKSLVGHKPYEITKMGVARTFQNIRLFKDLTVLDNVRLSYHFRAKNGLISSILRLPLYYKEEKQIEKNAMELLEIFGLHENAADLAKNLPYGKQRRLEIARALATSPRLLLLDEPAAGMNPQETMDLMETIKFVKEKFDLSVLLIEHDMKFVMNICEKIIVLDHGQTIARGVPDEIKRNPKVIEAYIGEEVSVSA